MSLLSLVTNGISNVVQTGKTIIANTLAPTGIAKSFVEANKSTFTSSIPYAATIAEHPYKTAAVVAVAAKPTQALAAVKEVATKYIPKVGITLKNTFSGLSLGGKITAVVATPIAAGVVTSSAKARESIIKTPGGLVNLGSNIGSAIENPSLSSISKIYKDNPVLASGATIAAGAATLGGLGLAANTVVTSLNTSAQKAKEKTEVIIDNIGQTAPQNISSYKDDLKLIEAQTKSQISIIEAQTKQAQQLAAIQTPQTGVSSITPTPTPVVAPIPKPKKKAKKKVKKKAKKKPNKKAKKKPKKKAKKRKVYKKRKKSKRR